MLCSRCWCLLVLVAIAPFSMALAQEAPATSASVEEFAAMLQAIDPYRPNQAAKGTIRVFGSTSMDAMAHGWSGGFKQFHPNTEVVISAAGTEATFRELAQNPSGVGMLSRPVKDEELQELKKLGLKEPVALVVAREALGVFVHASNPVSSISGEQLRTVFTTEGASGDLAWNTLGGTGDWSAKPIHVISRSARSGTQRFLAEFVFGGSTLREGVSKHVSNAEVLKAISGDPLSIAICGLRSSGKAVKPLQLTAGASVVPSDDHAVLSGQYPLTRPLTLLIDIGRQDEDALASREWVRYALCQAGQAKAILVGFFPVDLPLLRAGLQKLGEHQVR